MKNRIRRKKKAKKEKCQNQRNLWTLENIFLSLSSSGMFSEPLIFTVSLEDGICFEIVLLCRQKLHR